MEKSFCQTLLLVQAPLTLRCKVARPAEPCTGGTVVKQWLRGIRGGIGIGLIRAAVWAPVALVIDPDGSMDEMWPAIGA